MDDKPNMLFNYKRLDGGFTHTQYEKDGIVYSASTGCAAEWGQESNQSKVIKDGWDLNINREREERPS